jgi:YidC/Oxa1 family membrane protein insertase
MMMELTMANQLRDPALFAAVQSEVPEIAGLVPINFDLFGLNLAEVPSFSSLLFIVPLLSAGFSFLSAYLTQKFSGRPPAAGNTQKIMYLIGPGLSLWIGFTWPAALGVYWIAQSVLQIPQEYYLSKHFNKVLDEEDKVKVEREERRKTAEAAQKEEDRQRRAERIAAGKQKHKPKRYKLQNKPVPKEDTEDED